MKKRILSAFMALAMCLSLLPTATFADGEERSGEDASEAQVHSHCVCHGIGASLPSEANHTCEQLEFTEWTDTTSLPGEAGNYYLSSDVTISASWQPASGTVLCLNGHSIYMNTSNAITIEIASDTVFTLTDCADVPGMITHTEGVYGSGIKNSGTFHLYGGSISGNTTYIKSCPGISTRQKSTFNMYSGNISENTNETYNASATGCCGGGVDVAGRNATFNMYGGSITGNQTDYYSAYGAGVNIRDYATFYMYNGTIANNSAGVYAAGVFNDGTFIMTGGIITGNTAGEGGGGVMPSSSGTTVIGGNAQVTGNTSNGKADNVYIGHHTVLVKIQEDFTGSIGVTGSTPTTGNSVQIFTDDSATSFTGTLTCDDPSYQIQGKDIVLPVSSCTHENINESGYCSDCETQVNFFSLNGSSYKSFAEVYEALEGVNPDSVTLLADYSLSDTDPAELSKPLQLKLNGNTFTGDLTIKDCKFQVSNDKTSGKLDGTVTVKGTSDLLLYSGEVTKIVNEITRTDDVNVSSVFIAGGRVGTLVVKNGADTTFIGGSFGKIELEGTGGSFADFTSVFTGYYAYQDISDADTGLVKLSELSGKTSIENVKVVECTEHSFNTTHDCIYCGAHDTHCACFGKLSGTTGHTCTSVTWAKWYAPWSLPFISSTDEDAYYLPADITAYGYAQNFSGDKLLDLNGHSVKYIINDAIDITSETNFILTDCKGGGSITTSNSNSNCINVKGGDFTLYSGSLTGACNGVQVTHGSFTMYDGSVSTGNNADNNAAGVFLNNTGSLTIHGGTVDSLLVENTGNDDMLVNLYGGTFGNIKVTNHIKTSADILTPMSCVDLLADGYAYFSQNADTGKYDVLVKADVEEIAYSVKVLAHEHEFDSESKKCECGATCKHEHWTSYGDCEDCGLEASVSAEKDGEKYYFASVDDALAAKCYDITLLKDLENEDVIPSVGSIVSINLKGHKLKSYIAEGGDGGLTVTDNTGSIYDTDIGSIGTLTLNCNAKLCGGSYGKIENAGYVSLPDGYALGYIDGDNIKRADITGTLENVQVAVCTDHSAPDADGKCEYCQKLIVASIITHPEYSYDVLSTAYYVTIEEALEAIQWLSAPTAELSLLCDCTLPANACIYYSTVLTLNTGSYTLTGDLTIRDTSYSMKGFRLYGTLDGNVTIESGHFEFLSGTVTGNISTTTPEVDMTIYGTVNGTVTASAGMTSIGEGYVNAVIVKDDARVYFYEGEVGSLTVNGGSVYVRGGEFGSVTVNVDMNILDTGYAFKGSDNTWYESTSNGTSLTNVTAKVIPFESVWLSYSEENSYGEHIRIDSYCSLGYGYIDSDVTYSWTSSDSDSVLSESKYFYPTYLASLPVGSYTYYCKMTIDGYSITKTASFTVVKGTLHSYDYSAPGALADDLTYSAEPQSLVTAGELYLDDDDGVTIMYRLGENGSWSGNVPTATNVGDYTVYWYIDGGDNYNSIGSADEPAGSLNAKIVPCAVVITPSTLNKTYGRDDPLLFFITNLDFDSVLSNKFSFSKTGSLTRAEGENVGDYLISLGTLSAGDNFTVSLDTSKDYYFTIKAKNVAELSATVQDQSITLGSDSFTDPTIPGVNGEASATGSFTYSYNGSGSYTHDQVAEMLRNATPGADGGNVTVTLGFTFTGSGNYTGTNTGSFTITIQCFKFTVDNEKADANNAVSLGDCTYGKTWSEMLTLKTIVATLGSEPVSGSFTIVPDSGNLSDRPNVGTHTYSVVFSSDDGAYTNVPVFSGSITVGSKTVTADMISLVGSLTYDESTQTPTVTVKDGETTLVNGTDYEVSVTGQTNAGSYTLTVTGLGNYTGSADKEWTIAKKELTVSVSAEDKTYDGTQDATITEVVFTGLVTGDALVRGTDYSVSARFTANANVRANKDVSATITLLDTATANNYFLSIPTVTTTASISQKTINATVTVDEKTYNGDTIASVTATVDPADLIAGDSITISGLVGTFDDANVGTNKNVTIDSGSVAISGTNSGNYLVKFPSSSTGKIVPADAVVSVAPSANSLSYKGIAQALVTEGIAIGGEMRYSLDGEIWSETIPTGVNATDYTVYYKVVGDSNHIDSQPASVRVTIGKASLTVTAKPHSITYGEDSANNGVEYSGFVNGETEVVLDGTLGYDYSYTQYGDVGDYKITPNGLSSDNYSIEFKPGTLTVNPREIGIEWTNTSLTYNGQPQKPTATATGLVNDDTCTVTVTGEKTNAGDDYTATATSLSNGNYVLPENVTTVFSIGKASLTVTAKPHSITYGESPANNGVEYSGFVNGENEVVLDGTLGYDYSYTQYGDVGDYTITPSGLSSDNYSIEFKPGTLTVNPREIGIEWTNTSLTYNGQPQKPTATATGLVNNDTCTVTVTGEQTNAGDDYTATAASLSNGNYVLPENATTAFSIEKAPLTGVSVAQTGSLTYNGSEQTATVEALATTVDGVSVSFTYSTEQDGDYSADVPAFTVGEHTVWYKAEAANHVTATGRFTVTIGKATATIKALDKSTYVFTAAPDLSNPVLGEDYIINGLFGDDTLDSSVTVVLSCDANMNSCGAYPIIPSVTGEDSRYDFVFENGTLSVNGLPLKPSTGTTVTNPDGSTTTTIVDPVTGDVTETTTTPDGVIIIIVTDKDGNIIDITVIIPDSVVKDDETVEIPLPAMKPTDSEDAQEILVEVPSGGATIEIPVEDPTPGTVVVIVNPDGTETIIPTEITETGVEITIESDSVIKIIDNSETFIDVPDDAYYADAIDWASSRDIVLGVGGGRFAPDESCTRAQIITFLWRVAGCPEPETASSFDDVPADAYYAKAVSWGIENGITLGIGNNQFAPDQTCTRVQAVAFLFRYAAAYGMDAVTLQELVSGYNDADQVPAYALSALNWALVENIVKGYNGNLMPNDDCTRAQIVTMLYRMFG